VLQFYPDIMIGVQSRKSSTITEKNRPQDFN